MIELGEALEVIRRRRIVGGGKLIRVYIVDQVDCYSLTTDRRCPFKNAPMELPWSNLRSLSLSLLFAPFLGILPSLNPAEDPVPAMHQEPTVQHPTDKPQPLPILSPEEMHCRWHESRW